MLYWKKARQAAHPDLTLTGIYNVLEKLRAGEALTDKDRKIHDQGLVTILKQIHDDLDAAVFEAYGWSDLSANGPLCSGGLRPPIANEKALSLSPNGPDGHRPPLQDTSSATEILPKEELEQELLKRLVALNHERAAEEKRGLVRWLRPDYQAPDEKALPRATQDEIALDAGETAAVATVPDKLSWPANLPEQVAALHKLLPALGPDPDALAAAFGKRTKSRVTKISEILETLKTLGKL